MRRIYDHFFLAQLFHRAMLAGLTLFLIAVTLGSGTTLGQDDRGQQCRDNQTALKQDQDEADKIDAKLMVAEDIAQYSGLLASLADGMNRGFVANGFYNVLRLVNKYTGEHRDPKNSAQQLVAQRELYSVLKQIIGEVAPRGVYDQLVTQQSGIRTEIDRMQRRMTFLNCQVVLEREATAAESGAAATPTFDITGTWKYGTAYSYSITQSGATFTWTLPHNNERANGKITGNSVSASWTNKNGSGSATGTITFNASGWPVQIDWSNGAVFIRQ